MRLLVAIVPFLFFLFPNLKPASSELVPAAASAQPRLAWTFRAPAAASELLTLNASGQGMIFAVFAGESRDLMTESGTSKETGSSVVALDLSTGQKRWSYQTRFKIYSPLLFVGGRVIVHDGYGNVACLNAVNGKAHWTIDPEKDNAPPGFPPTPRMGPWNEQTMPAGNSQRLYLREQGELACRSLDSGKALWKIPVDAVSNRVAYSALSGERVLFFTASDDVLVVDAGSGREIWKASPQWLDDGVVVARDAAFFSNPDGLYCASLGTGKLLWKIPWSAPDSRAPGQLVQGRAIAAWQNLVLVSRKNLFLGKPEIAAIEIPTHAIRWSYPLPGMTLSGLSVAGSRAVVVLENRIVVIDLASGKLAWEHAIPGEKNLFGQALVSQGKILVSGSLGLYCLDTGDAVLSGWTHCAGSAARSGNPE